jgi:hypothetical protein
MKQSARFEMERERILERLDANVFISKENRSRILVFHFLFFCFFEEIPSEPRFPNKVYPFLEIEQKSESESEFIILDPLDQSGQNQFTASFQEGIDIRYTNLWIPPSSNSKQSLWIRFGEGSLRSLYFNLIQPKDWNRLGVEMSLWVYSSEKSSSSLESVWEDSEGKRSLIPLCPLNFKGWKDCKAKFPLSFSQTKGTFDNQVGIKFKGFYLIVPWNENKRKNYFICIDDFRITGREKWKSMNQPKFFLKEFQ